MDPVVAHRGAARSFALMIPGTSSSSGAVSPMRGGGWRAFSRATLELAGMAGVTLRLYRAAVLSIDTFADWPVFIGALVVGVVFVCGVLTWYLSNFPLRRWPSRVAAFVGIEVAAEFGMSSVLIALRREPLGSGLATWADWWPLAGQTLLERGLVLGGYAGLLAGAMWIVTRKRPS
jgi:hypothetical protein